MRQVTAVQIPVLDMAEMRQSTAAPVARARFVDALSRAFSEVGFAGLRGHGVPRQLVERSYRAAAAFFALPEADKLRYHRPELSGARGYTPFGVETAKDHSHADLKEFWHVGRERTNATADADTPPHNLWPDEIGDFRAATGELFTALDRLGDEVLSAIALGLELPETHFANVTDRGNSILRPLHYPPIDGDPRGAIRAGAHEDINLITLLVGSRQPGLQILTRDGDWIDAPGGEELIICNVGDMLQRLTNHVLTSTTHRVVNPADGGDNVSRYSIPFFLHPNSDFVIRTLPGCISDDRPDRYPDSIIADDYLKQRLREIGLL